MVALYAPAGRPAPQVGNSFVEPPAGTKMVEVFVIVVNQHAKAAEDGLITSLTLPEKPFTLVTVITVCLSESTGIDWKVGFSAIAKSPGETLLTVTDMLTPCPSEPLEPETNSW